MVSPIIEDKESDYDVTSSPFVTARGLTSASRHFLVSGGHHNVDDIDVNVDFDVELGAMLIVDAGMQYILHSTVHSISNWLQYS